MVEGFSHSYEHFNGVYKASKDDVGRIVQFYAKNGDMDKGPFKIELSPARGAIA